MDWDEWMDEWMEGWTHRQGGGWLDGQADGWMGGCRDRHMDRHTGRRRCCAGGWQQEGGGVGARTDTPQVGGQTDTCAGTAVPGGEGALSLWPLLWRHQMLPRPLSAPRGRGPAGEVAMGRDPGTTGTHPGHAGTTLLPALSQSPAGNHAFSQSPARAGAADQWQTSFSPGPAHHGYINRLPHRSPEFFGPIPDVSAPCPWMEGAGSDPARPWGAPSTLSCPQGGGTQPKATTPGTSNQCGAPSWSTAVLEGTSGLGPPCLHPWLRGATSPSAHPGDLPVPVTTMGGQNLSPSTWGN